VIDGSQRKPANDRCPATPPTSSRTVQQEPRIAGRRMRRVRSDRDFVCVQPAHEREGHTAQATSNTRPCRQQHPKHRAAARRFNAGSDNQRSSRHWFRTEATQIAPPHSAVLPPAQANAA
jgi:hypothetical protein